MGQQRADDRCREEEEAGLEVEVRDAREVADLVGDEGGEAEEEEDADGGLAELPEPRVDIRLVYGPVLF